MRIYLFCHKCSRYVVAYGRKIRRYVKVKIPCPHCGIENEVILCQDCALKLVDEILQQINKQSKPDFNQFVEELKK